VSPAPDAAVLAAADVSREELGRFVRQRWIEWAMRQPHPKRSWLVPYGELSFADQEADDLIGVALFCAGWHARGRVQNRTGPEPGPAGELRPPGGGVQD
jgi:hypothetical protein